MRIGIDVGGTKIAAVLVGRDGRPRTERRSATPRDYDATIASIRTIVADLDAVAGEVCAVGLGFPGLVDPVAGQVRAVNLPWLADKPIAADLGAILGRSVRLANDAHCFALSEAIDGAGAGAEIVFGAVLGTGVGGGLVVGGRLVTGLHGAAGEWGHTPLPWRDEGDGPPRLCACGRIGCIETEVAGVGLVDAYAREGGTATDGGTIAARAGAGEAAAQAAIDRYFDRLARALGLITAILDPGVIVLGGGLSALPGLFEAVPQAWRRHAHVSCGRTVIAPARFGVDSGMRGAALLWP